MPVFSCLLTDVAFTTTLLTQCVEINIGSYLIKEKILISKQRFLFYKEAVLSKLKANYTTQPSIELWEGLIEKEINYILIS